MKIVPLFLKNLIHLPVIFFFALMQKGSKKNQGKTNAPPFCQASAT
jgi:hypothetical protein